MSDYWHEDDYEYEPEPEIELPAESGEVKIQLSINAGQIEAAVQKHCNEILEPRIKQMVKGHINSAMKTLLKKESWGTDHFKEILIEIIEKRLGNEYPEIVENKVNEFREAIMKLEYSESRRDSCDAIHAKAKRKVDSYIENELVDSVKRSKEYIEQFSKNYFANNLFKAMGMMDKMLPQTESSITE